MSIACGHLKLQAEDGKHAPKRILILNDGDIKWAGITGVTLDRKQAETIIAHFVEQGSEIVIDYHHSTRAVEDGRREKAPAAGWIFALEYVLGEGMYGAVRWNAEAAAEIERGEFKYYSPVILTDPKTKKIEILHSVALTNKPLTIDAPQLLAAEMHSVVERMQDDVPEKAKLSPAQGIKAIGDLVRKLTEAGLEIGDDSTFRAALDSLVAMIMPSRSRIKPEAAQRIIGDLIVIVAESRNPEKIETIIEATLSVFDDNDSDAASARSSNMKKATKTANKRKIIGTVPISAEEEVAPGLTVDVEALPEDQVKALDAVGAAIALITETLIGKGAEIPEGATSEEILAIANDMLKGGASDDIAASDDTTNKTTESIAGALGMKKTSTLKAIVGSLKVTSGQNTSITERLEALEEENAGYRNTIKAECAQKEVDKYVAESKINPNRKDHYKACMDLATADPERFTAIMAHAPLVMAPEGVTVTGRKAVATKTGRAQVIESAKTEWEAMSAEKREEEGGDDVLLGFLDTKLSVAQFPPLSPDEFKKLND